MQNHDADPYPGQKEKPAETNRTFTVQLVSAGHLSLNAIIAHSAELPVSKETTRLLLRPGLPSSFSGSFFLG